MKKEPKKSSTAKKGKPKPGLSKRQIRPKSAKPVGLSKPNNPGSSTTKPELEKKFKIDEAAFEKQLAFINDPAKLKALFCTRRAAKSYTGGLYLIKEALENPRSNCVYIALTRETAKGIIWKDILKELNQKYELGMEFNGTTLEATLPNESIIRVTGADADEDEMNKLLGKKYRLAVIDEASMFSVNMRQLVYGVLKPATADQRGTICLLGTASNITRGLFYDITTGKETGWSLHEWTAYENPHVASQWKEEILEIESKRPSFQKTTLYKQWYLNQWVIDSNALVYKFLRANNEATQLPMFASPWRNVLGVHVGHAPDPSAFVIARYNDESPLLFVTHAEQRYGIDAKTITDRIQELDNVYNFEVKVITGLEKGPVDEMNSRYQANVVAEIFEEKEKEHWINLINSDLGQKKVYFYQQTEELKQEMETLVWETDGAHIKLPRKQHKGIENHISNAFMALWKNTYPYLYTKPIAPAVKIEDWEKNHIQHLENQVRRDQNPHHFDAEFLPEDELFDFDKDDVI